MIPQYYPLAIGYQTVIIIVEFALSILIFRRYATKRTLATLFLSLTVVALTIAGIFEIIGLILDLYASGTQIPQAFPIMSVFVADVFILLFVLEVFHKLQTTKKIKIIAAIYIFITAVVLIYIFASGLVLAVDLPSSIIGIVLIFSIVVAFFFARDCWHIAQRLEDSDDKRAMNMMFLSPVFFILGFGITILDTILNPDIPVFDALSWFIYLGSLLSALVGYLRPKWFNRRAEMPAESTS